MGYWSGPSEQNRQEDLEARVRKLERFAIAHQQWEEELVAHGFVVMHGDGMPEKIKEGFDEVRRLRNEAMKMG